MPAPADRLDHVLRPISVGFAVPVFAFFASGVAVGGWGAFTEALGRPITLGVVIGLVAGKPVGVLLGTWVAARVLRADLAPELSWWDVAGVAVLCGMGFTVSLLISELAFDGRPADVDASRIGVLTGTVIAALLASVVLVARNRRHRGAAEAEAEAAAVSR